MNAWEAQFGYDFEKKLVTIRGEVLAIKSTFSTSISLKEKQLQQLKPSLLNNTLLALDKKITHQLNILKHFDLPNNLAIKKLRKLSANVHKKINDIGTYHNKGTYQEKCIILLHEINEWQKETLFLNKEKTLGSFQKKLNRLEHETVYFNTQKHSLTAIIRKTVEDYYAHLTKTKSSKKLRNKQFFLLFKDIAIINHQGVRINKDFNSQTISPQFLLNVINLIFKRARKQTLYYQHPATTLLLSHLDNEAKNSSVFYRKQTFKKHEVFFKINHEERIVTLKQQLYKERQRLIEDKETINLFNKKLVHFQTLYLDVKHHYDYKQRENAKLLLKDYELILEDNKRLLENHYPTPFCFKRVTPIFVDKTINQFDETCSFYYEKIRILITQVYRHAPNQSSHSLDKLYPHNKKRKTTQLLPLVSFLYQHQEKLKDMNKHLIGSKGKVTLCKSNSLGLLLLKNLIKKLNSTLRHTPYPTQSEKLIQYLDEFLSQPILKNNSYKDDFMAYYNFIMKPLSDYTMDFITSTISI